jgi:hypothetical protein
VVQGVLIASAALAGLSLVFLGLVLYVRRSRPSLAPGAGGRDYRILATLVASACFFGLLSLSLCVWWLAAHLDSTVRHLAVAAFVIQVLLLITSAASVPIVFLWKGPHESRSSSRLLGELGQRLQGANDN